ncbi:MAG: oxidoreductase [Candidatus Handelsmanbacteria bacterium RIFCSPLOWO2_12_FULL_64_10]|uniref:Oxidoreductase n=1 Tax=Handelsmanbacteria sp. (strain RIFCSPLOWO2_12_FULL_64_10) TaxID=1817868 RepID=A0A1F6CBS4_HANXR|nr:MAG: oxidoreductase [Candidatus Handelsmanbacteria bacterium RIFCSPLOWO2_12_FULL_64_10]
MNIIAQIGCGYWGPNLLRNFSAQPGCHVKWVVDQSPQRRAFVESNYPKTKAVPDWETALNDPEVEAVVIATPAATHCALAMDALRSGRHVFVEKPLAMSTQEADDLKALSASANRTLMVGHTFLYNAAVRYVRQLLDGGDLGDVYYIYSQRLNLGQVRSDVNAWWNLAPHDVSILLYLMGGELPASVSAHGVDYIQPGIEDVVFAVLTWRNRATAHIHVSWLDPGKVRRVTLVGGRKMIVYDDVSDDKIAILDKGVDRAPRPGERMDYDQFNAYQLIHRTGDVYLPRIDFQEPLKVEAAHFLECIRTGQTPLTGPQHARDVVAVLAAGQRSLREGGRSVAVI